jgi:hypothetical protein
MAWESLRFGKERKSAWSLLAEIQNGNSFLGKQATVRVQDRAG